MLKCLRVLSLSLQFMSLILTHRLQEYSAGLWINGGVGVVNPILLLGSRDSHSNSVETVLKITREDIL